MTSPLDSPTVQTAAVDPAWNGLRLDAALRRVRPELSQTQARALCAAGAVALDGVRSAASVRIGKARTIDWYTGDLERTLRLSLPIVAERDGVLVLHKPPGLAVHGGPLVDDSVAARLAATMPGVGLAQRLDRPASGLLLCGRDAAALAALGAAMERGAIARHYLAVTAGVVDGDARTIDLPLRVTDEPFGDRPKVVVDGDGGQPARTHLQVLARSRAATLVRLTLDTGRTHQIRAHLRAIGHPLLGDPRYGDAAANAAARATHGIDRAMLHCAELRLPTPATGSELHVRALLEPDFARMFPRWRPD
ncbi:MAG: pseudouridine synthase [Planctomycetota bacterium]